jgi:undecaprenyl-diphosphatase
MDFIYSILLGLIEGITEYLPISSTGHLLVASELMVFVNRASFLADKNVRQTFDIVIQVGPIIALLIYFRKEILEIITTLPTNRATQRFALNILIAFIPAGVVGVLLGKLVEDPRLIALALIVGGVVFILVEQRDHKPTVLELSAITPAQALIIGCAQILALIPGVSRSGATIVAGLLIGVERRVITQFTFYLAIPTLIIATGYSLFKASRAGELGGANLPLLAIGTLVAALSAYAAIAWFLRYVSTHSFRAFGIYRIVFGAIVLILALATTLLSY